MNIPNVLVWSGQGYKYIYGKIVTLTKQAVVPWILYGKLYPTFATFAKAGYAYETYPCKIGSMEYEQVPK
jgi:hypothetical protein